MHLTAGRPSGLIGAVSVAAIALATTRPSLAQDPAAEKARTVPAALRIVLREERETFERDQTFLIKSRPNLKLALSLPHIARLPIVQKQRHPVAWLEMNLRLEFQPFGEMGSSLEELLCLKIALRGDSTDELATIVNAVTDVYLEHVRMKHDRRIKALNDDIAARERQLAELEKTVEEAQANRERLSLVVGSKYLEEHRLELARIRLRQQRESGPPVRLLQRAASSPRH